MRDRRSWYGWLHREGVRLFLALNAADIDTIDIQGIPGWREVFGTWAAAFDDPYDA
jgi:hypothetical protein